MAKKSSKGAPRHDRGGMLVVTTTGQLVHFKPALQQRVATAPRPARCRYHRRRAKAEGTASSDNATVIWPPSAAIPVSVAAR